MRFLTRILLNLLGRNFTVIPWMGLIIGLGICLLAITFDGLFVFQQLHLSIYGISTKGVVYEKFAETDGKYYIGCSFLIKKTDGSVESVSRTGITSSSVYETLRKGDKVEVVYSSRRPEIWMIKEHVEEVFGAGIISCFGFILIIFGGGGVYLMRPKKPR